MQIHFIFLKKSVDIEKKIYLKGLTSIPMRIALFILVHSKIMEKKTEGVE